MNDKETILAAARNIDRITRVSVRTDLPQEKIATVAYNMRQEQHYQTAIRESAREVWLEFRPKKGDP